jgi:predicted enzyme related to lactoylglutathione lyase
MLPLSQMKVTTVLPVHDMERARSFYEGKLGFADPDPMPDGSLVYHLKASDVALLPTEGGAEPEHTAISFEVSDIDDGIRTLEKAGVAFEDYDQPGLKTVNHIFDAGTEKCAWFRDTEGNYLCLHQPVG